MKLNSEMIDQILSLVRETGDFIREEAGKFSVEKIEQKGKNDLVSYVDKTAERLLTEGCLKIIPGSGFIREEEGELLGENEFRWIIDPLDGTTNFIHGVPAYSISLALQITEITVFGIVYDVSRDEMFSAGKGFGAFLNAERIQVSQTPNLAQSLIATGFPYTRYGGSTAFLAVLKDILEHCQGIRRFGSAALDLAWVACGRFDGFYETTLNSWDIAAGILLVEEAGGKISDYSGGENALFGKQIAATNKQIHPELLRIIKEKF